MIWISQVGEGIKLHLRDGSVSSCLNPAQNTSLSFSSPSVSYAVIVSIYLLPKVPPWLEQESFHCEVLHLVNQRFPAKKDFTGNFLNQINLLLSVIKIPDQILKCCSSSA